MRKSVYVSEFKHGNNPIPAACVVGNLLVSGAIFGTDPGTGKLSETAEAQCADMFSNLRSVLSGGGATLDEVVKMTFYLRPDVSRNLINAEWIKAFPDEKSRPARHVIINERLPAGMFMQCDVMAVLGGGVKQG